MAVGSASTTTATSTATTSAATTHSNTSTAAGPVVTLPAFNARDWAISDFGMSVKTNFEVTHGGSVEWMEISALISNGPAKNAGLAVGDRIIAIDRELVTKLGREGLLDALFKRKSGDRVRLLITTRREALPRFIEVVARRP